MVISDFHPLDRKLSEDRPGIVLLPVVVPVLDRVPGAQQMINKCLLNK